MHLPRLRWFRYVFSEMITPTILGLSLYTFLLLMNAFFLIAEKTLSRNLGWDLTFRMVGYELPKVLVLTIPMAVLLGAMIAVGRLSADHEWVALQGAGFGPGRLLRPVAVFGLVSTLIAFWIYGYLVPRTNYAARNLRTELIYASNIAADLRAGVFYTQLQDTVMFIDNIRPGGEGRLEGVIIQRRNVEFDRDEMILARLGDIYPAADASGELQIDLRDGVVHTYRSNEPEQYATTRFNDWQLTIPPPPFLAALQAEPQQTVSDMNPAELIRELRETAQTTDMHPLMLASRKRVASLELHQRLALPATCLLFAILALPLGVTRARSGKGAGFALSLLVILIYWVVFTVTKDQARLGNIPAWLGAWAANLVMLPWAAIAYWRLARSLGERRGLIATVVSGVRGLARGVRSLGASRSETPARRPEEPSEIYSLAGTSRRFVGRLDRYVGLQFLRVTGFALLSAYMIYSIVELKRLLDGVFKNEQPLSLIGDYFFFAIPGMLNLVLPVSCLVGAIVGFTLLARTGELTAITSSGTSIRRSLAPVILLTVLLSGGLFVVQDRVAPMTNRKAAEVKDQILNRTPTTYGMTPGGRWAFGPNGSRLYHFRLYDQDREQFQGFTVFTLDRGQQKIRGHLFSPVARWSEAGWELESGWNRSFTAEGRQRAFDLFDEPRTFELAAPEEFTRREATLASAGTGLNEQMSVEEIRLQLRELASSGYDTTRLQVSYWNKFAQPLTPLVMVLLGLPFAFKVGRRGSLYGIGVAILLVLVYWATFAIFNAMGLETVLPPMLAAWAPNVLFGLLGLYLILWIRT